MTKGCIKLYHEELRGLHPSPVLSGWQFNEEELGRVCYTRRKEVKCIPSFDWKVEEKDCLEKLDGATLEGNIKTDLKK
jgi:hypothetical protein